MARRPDTTAATETLHEIESIFDRMAGWVTSHPRHFLLGIGAILSVTAAWSLQSWYQNQQSQEASGAVAQVRADYLEALGTPAGSLEAIEPANPETAQQVRKEYIKRFLEVASSYDGSAAATLARLEAGNLQAREGDRLSARATFEAAVRDAPAQAGLRALALQRLARSLEDLNVWDEAAERHEQAAESSDYPLRYEALADAARCFAEAGQRDRAVALVDRLDAEAPEAQLQPHLQAHLDQLRSQSGG